MFKLPEQAALDQHEMSALRRSLKRPETYLIVLAFLAVLVAIDAMRPVGQQLSAHAYLSLIRAYQHWGRPMSEGIIACRYQPTCSEYSKQAVERFGIARGLELTIGRLRRCARDVPAGTWDEPPSFD